MLGGHNSRLAGAFMEEARKTPGEVSSIAGLVRPSSSLEGVKPADSIKALAERHRPMNWGQPLANLRNAKSFQTGVGPGRSVLQGQGLEASLQGDKGIKSSICTLVRHK